MDYNDILQEIRLLFQKALAEKLVGIYVHGSIAFGCFNWDQSDIDFLVVVDSEMTQSEKLTVMERLAALEARAPKKGLEMSVMQLKDTRNFQHPARFELHYSKMHRERYLEDPIAYCQSMCGRDPDLAAHCTVVREVGIVLCGRPIQEVFGPVPREAYLDSIRGDIQNAEEEVLTNPMYVILNLCRVLAYIQEGLVLSKQQGGEWGLTHLPDRYSRLLSRAMFCYHSKEAMEKDLEMAPEFCRCLLKECGLGGV